MIPGIEARDEVGVGTSATVEDVITASAADEISVGGADEGIVAVASIEEEVTAGELNVGEIEDVIDPAAEDADLSFGAGGSGGVVDDLLDARGSGEGGSEADINGPRALGEDGIDARGP